ncbi:MAG TPA: tRNA (guanosine(37)-N1)-methyltransferase TrmD [Candidatus Babeliales bacterium]|nr:tRNA (guanosine(37)-N1)-methyltransferase TrmD [Candidatus Babeliales bacterium]
MNISILSVFPELYTSFLTTSLMHRAQERGLVSISVESFFSYAEPKERIDAPTFGHGDGMLLRPDIVEKAIEDRERLHGKALKIFFSPHGKKLTQRELQRLVERMQQTEHVLCVAGRYEGMDARVEQEYADEIVSIGDYVLMGGDLPVMVMLEGALRLIPGVISKPQSVARDSFQGALVDYPEYTAPVVWRDKQVPEVVRSGNHALLEEWRCEQSVERTLFQHFDWLRESIITEKEKKQVQAIMPHHYVVLAHGDVLVGPEREKGTTSVTSIDIHDIARSSATYGIKQFFIVTPLADQHRIVTTLLDFWQKGAGIEYNRVRHTAINQVSVLDTIEDAIAAIVKREGLYPLLVATSARQTEHMGQITYYDQAVAWETRRPLLFIFGTGQGLTKELIDRCDYLLPPVAGFSDFNHLSVRSAVAIVLDRWLGNNQKNR